MSGFFKALWEHPVYILVIYLVLMNLALFLVMGADKSRAKRQRRRVPEATLFLLALIGGSFGGIIGMAVFHHKTKHLSFLVGFPAILIAQLIIVYLLFII